MDQNKFQIVLKVFIYLFKYISFSNLELILSITLLIMNQFLKLAKMGFSLEI